MFEQDWLTSANPRLLMKLFASTGTLQYGPTSVPVFYPQKLTKRHYRLLACAFCRHDKQIMADARCLIAVQTAELFADKEADLYLLRNAYNMALASFNNRSKCWQFSLALSACVEDIKKEMSRLLLRAGRLKIFDLIQCDLIRDIAGNPWQSLKPLQAFGGLMCHPWLAWNDGTVRKIARGIYDNHDFASMPILADALQEAGCQDKRILDHLLAPCLYCQDAKFDTGDSGNPVQNPKLARHWQTQCVCGGSRLRLHARGCHVLDNLLGKT